MGRVPAVVREVDMSHIDESCKRVTVQFCSASMSIHFEHQGRVSMTKCAWRETYVVYVS